MVPRPPRDVQVQTLEDDEELVSFSPDPLYNGSDDFTNYPDNYDLEILLDSIYGDANSNKIPPHRSSVN